MILPAYFFDDNLLILCYDCGDINLLPGGGFYDPGRPDLVHRGN